jgi:formylglycine-generating enzyme required for sulfatase activity
MLDQRLEELKRQFAADPKSSQLQCELLNARARVEGPSVYLEALNDRLKWNECSEPLQDMTINAVGERLKPDYKWLETLLYSCPPAPDHGISHRIASFAHLKSGLILNLIPGGSYKMGDEDDVLRRPVQLMTVKPVLIGRFPVTQICWDKIGGEDFRSVLNPNSPINSMNWIECLERLKRAGGGLRLPHEAEWEYACRAGSVGPYFWSSDNSGDMDRSYCWHGDHCDSDIPNEVVDVTLHFDSGKWNSFGLIYMSGNVSEMRQDKSHGKVVNRGGSSFSQPYSCRSGIRGYEMDFSVVPRIGFRVVRSLD